MSGVRFSHAAPRPDRDHQLIEESSVSPDQPSHGSTPDLPVVALAMAAPVAERQFREAEWERLRAVSRPYDTVINDFTDRPAQDALADAEVLVTSWGCPTVDDRVLALAPRLKAIVHAA